MEFLKSVTGKVVSGLVGLAVVMVAVSWWRMDETGRSALLGGSGRVLGWLGIVLVAPWATFFLSTWAGRFERNAAGAALVAGYVAAELLLLAWLFDWHVRGGVAWTFFILGGLFAAVYNLFTCDWIAEKIG